VVPGRCLEDFSAGGPIAVHVVLHIGRCEDSGEEDVEQEAGKMDLTSGREYFMMGSFIFLPRSRSFPHRGLSLPGILMSFSPAVNPSSIPH
jgi:hypothetical protein